MADDNSPTDPDEHPTNRIEPVGVDHAPSTVPIDPAAYSSTTPPPADRPVAPESRWSRVRRRAGSTPWVPVTAVGVGAAIVGAVVASAVFLANPVHDDVSNASSNSALPASGGPGQSGAPAAPGGSGAPAAPDGGRGPMPGHAGPEGKDGPGGRDRAMCMPPPDGKGPQGPPASTGK